MDKIIAIRADSNSEIGFGHLMRTQALAWQLEKLGARVIFLTRNPENIKGFEVIGLLGEGEQEEDELVAELVRSCGAGMLIIDSYAYGQERLERMGCLPVLTVYIDDLNRHSFMVDFVVNGNLYAPELDYQGKARFLLGRRYLLLGSEYKGVPLRRVNPEVRNILLTFGGADVINFTGTILGLLRRYPRLDDFHWEVVIGPVNRYRDHLEREFGGHQNINLHFNPRIKELMDFCDISISAAGSTTYELAACGVPPLLVVTADNQLRLAEAAARQGVAVNLGWHERLMEGMLFQGLDSLVEKAAVRQGMADRGQRIFDGRGAERVANILMAALGGDVFAGESDKG